MPYGKKKTKNVRLRLYRVQDFDLYSLFYDRNFRFNDAVRAVVTSYAHGKPLPLLDVSKVMPVRGNAGNTAMDRKRKFIVILTCSIPDEDGMVSEFMDYLYENGRNGNTFVKFLLRRALCNAEGIFMDKGERERFADPGLSDEVLDLFGEGKKKRAQKPGKVKKAPAGELKSEAGTKPEPVQDAVKAPVREENGFVLVNDPVVTENYDDQATAERLRSSEDVQAMISLLGGMTV